jgi:hypothetical protein
MAFIIPLILVAIYVNQLKHWIQHTLADCVGLVRHWIRMFRDGCTLLQQWMRIRRRYAARDLETGDTLEYGTEKGSGPIFTSATEDAAERVEPVQRRRLIG